MNELYLEHYGTPRHSGRYPWGSGENPYQHSGQFLAAINDLKKEGASEKEIASYFGMTTTELRSYKSRARAEKWAADSAEAWRLKEKGYSNVAIGERMGRNESSVRLLLDEHMAARNNATENVANALKECVDKNKYIDVSEGVNLYMNISEQRMKHALDILEEQGYSVVKIQVPQMGSSSGQKTTITVLAPTGTTAHDIYESHLEDIVPPNVRSEGTSNGQELTKGFQTPENLNSSRLAVRYSEDGGSEMDGVIELRRGVEDISLGGSNYAQVRIAVDGTHYLKGMAVYSDDLPKGVDVRFNTNKSKGTPVMGDEKNTVLKLMKDDKSNPFGATIKDISEGGQRYYTGKDGKEHLSVINKVNDEGDWMEWKKSIASQMLSKQQVPVARKQLDKAYSDKLKEYREIQAMTNPTVKKHFLESFADDCDAAAVHLKAASFPRQASQVILPIKSLGDDEIYAPNYKHGEKVVLVRYPHGGRFEMPELTVNNHNAEGARVITSTAKDAVGINSKVAARLSGADFDGDTVLVIPNNNGAIKTAKPLAGLKDFDPCESFPGYDGMSKMKTRTRNIEMGKVSNLITDMTLAGATSDELERAVKHSMVVIDAKKHNLNYKESYRVYGIADLKKKYQPTGGASTLISRAKSPENVPERKLYYLSPNTINEKGEKVYKETGRSYTDKNGKTVYARTESSKMAEAKDAFDLSSGTKMEAEYAKYANNLKSLANQARKEWVSTKANPYSPSAAKTYSAEVASLNSKLNTALKNAPLERQAQRLAYSRWKAKVNANEDMSAEDKKKLKGRELTRARNDVGAGKETIHITDREWEAIQKGAISNNKLEKILRNTKSEVAKKLATPRTQVVMTQSKVNRAKALAANGYTLSEIAEKLGVSTSTISKAISS